MAETLLACPEGDDVICLFDHEIDQQVVGSRAVVARRDKEVENSRNKGGILLVKADERISFAQSHYDMAREGLEEIGTCVEIH